MGRRAWVAVFSCSRLVQLHLLIRVRRPRLLRGLVRLVGLKSEKDGFALLLAEVHAEGESEEEDAEQACDNDQCGGPRGNCVLVFVQSFLGFRDERASEARRVLYQHFIVEEIDTGLEIHRSVSSCHVNGCRDHVQGCRAIAGAECRGTEWNRDVICLLNDTRVTEVAAVVQVVDLADRRVPRSVDDDHHVGVSSQHVARVDASPASLKMSEHVVGRPRPRSDEEELVEIAVLIFPRLSAASDAVQPDCIERMLGPFQRLLSDVKVVLNFGDELKGHVGHVEYRTHLGDRRVHSLLAGAVLRVQGTVFAIPGLEPSADACCVQLWAHRCCTRWWHWNRTGRSRSLLRRKDRQWRW
eukprot:scaffold37731_cov67-Phaeocystis_antarctica.AAC.3